ncbi:hypothetical protein V6N13_134869 [Hibiscus sabdariffa]
MTSNSSEEIHGGSASPNGSLQNYGFLSSTTTSPSDDRNSADSNEKKSRLGGETSNSLNSSLITEANPSPDTPTFLIIGFAEEYQRMGFNKTAMEVFAYALHVLLNSHREYVHLF